MWIRLESACRRTKLLALLGFVACNGCVPGIQYLPALVSTPSNPHNNPLSISRKDTFERAGVTSLLLVGGAGAIAGGAGLLACSGGRLGCFSVQSAWVQSPPPRTDEAAVGLTGLTLLTGGVIAFLMAPVYAIISGPAE